MPKMDDDDDDDWYEDDDGVHEGQGGSVHDLEPSGDDEEEIYDTGLVDQYGNPILGVVYREPKSFGFLAYDENGGLRPRHEILP